MTYMKSEGNIHESLSDEDSVRYGHQEAELAPTVISSTSSGGGGATGHHHSLERRGGPQRQQAHPRMINGALATSDQLGNFAVMGEGAIPPMQSYKVPPPGAHDDRKRESMFSETSSEGNNEASGQGRRESLFSESSGDVPISNGHTSGGPAGAGGPARAGGPAGAGRNKDKNCRKGSVFSETSTESSNNSRSPGE